MTVGAPWRQCLWAHLPFNAGLRSLGHYNNLAGPYARYITPAHGVACGSGERGDGAASAAAFAAFQGNRLYQRIYFKLLDIQQIGSLTTQLTSN